MRKDQDTPHQGAASNVIVMNRHRTDARFPHVSMVEAYWHALRGRRAVPGRAEVDPRGIEASLEYAFILEQIAPGVGRLRIAGTHLADLLGMEVRGMPLSAFFETEARDALAACLETVCGTPTIATLSLQADPGIGKPVLEARLLLLPLRGEDGGINRILGCLDSSGSIGRTPRRFVIRDRRLRQIGGYDETAGGTAPREVAQSLRSTHGFADRVTPFRPYGQTPAKAKPSHHLRLVTPDL
ncbi:MAG: PAS domain-containing protein [Paracoccaceae bacterium]|nr:PAS domain-containing protein [Paracoccaceae bacterium]